MTKTSELDAIRQLIEWAHEKGALHIKTPYIEMVFPPKEFEAAPVVDSVRQDDEKAKAGLYRNPVDDPDYYSVSQEQYYGHAIKDPAPR